MNKPPYRADLIRAEIGRQKMTHEELAEKSGVNRTTISGIVNEKSDPLVSTLQKIATALGINLATLFQKQDTA